VARRGEPHVLVMDVKPWLHPPQIESQTVTIGANDRLLGTIGIPREGVFGLVLDGRQTLAAELVVSLDHLDAPLGQTIAAYHDGQAMGLIFKSVRLFALTERARLPPAARAPFPGSVADGSLQQAVERATGRSTADILRQFESLGHRCQFGGFQARMGASSVGLLCFAGLSTPVLVRNLVQRFAGIGEPASLHAYDPQDGRDTWRLYDSAAEIWFNTSQPMAQTTIVQVEAQAARRLPFLRRKFLEDLAAAEKLFFLHSAYPLSEAEALAVFVALDLDGRNTLVWTNQDGDAAPGTVERLAPGFLYGRLDRLGEDGDPSDEAWLNVAANALLLRNE
jgi:hypothetical protein